MPFTKSVHIKIPQENLKNIQIVDTPGVNDPVVSREERTRELLKFCDVVFIVSPAGQFMSNEDLELMDRITSKEGIRELFVVASKCDMQLYGSIKEGSGGDLHRAFNSITTDLASSLHSTLSNLKRTNPEVGTVYDKLIKQSKESVIHSSGISLTIKETYDNQNVLDSGESHAWGLLLDNYPDYFSKTDKKLTIPNLDLLSNMDVINKAVSNVKEKKDEILANRKEEFLKAKLESLQQYKKALLNYIEIRIDEINNGDINELQEIRKRLKSIKNNVSEVLDQEYYDFVDELEIDIRQKLNSELNSYFRSTQRDIDNAEGNETESYDVKKEGAGNWIARKLWGGGYKTQTRTYTTVRAGAVRDSLINLTNQIEQNIENESKKYISSWKKNLTPKLLTVLRDNVDDEDLNITQIRKVIRNIINSVPFSEISYSSNTIPSGSGTLIKSRAESFIDEAKSYVYTLQKRVNKDINDYLTKLINTLEKLKNSSEIFSEYESEHKELEKQIVKKNITFDEFYRIKKEIKEVE
ncbi:MAG TPA: hypothetical protein ENK66_06885 [Arcobacter sp.]|nr:hypothetical protein [Arcobacter sp.]